MPRGKYTNHKGRARRFTSPEELEEQSKEQEQKYRRKKQLGSDDEEEAAGGKGSDESESESESEEETVKGKGVEKLIAVKNPNRVQPKSKKITDVNPDEVVQPELSRKEREELEKEKATAHYLKLHSEGKTEEARADLARLAIIKQQREEAAKKREAEKQAKEAAKLQKTAQTQKALGKKS